MSEYIDRAAVHELVKSIPHYQMFNYDRTESRRGISPDDVDFGVDKIPAADVAEVRHGRLISTGYDELYCEFGNCTVCGADNPIYNKFCGQCGARMGKEDGHEID